MYPIKLKTAIAKFKKYQILVNDNGNTELLKKILDGAFDGDFNIGGHSKYYYRQTTGYFDSWVNTSSCLTISDGEKHFFLSDVVM